MNLRVSLILIVLCICGSAIAQNIKNEKMDVRYLQLPYNPLDKQFSTYRKSIELFGLSVEDSRENMTNSIATRAVINGLKEVQSGADLELYVRVEAFSAQDLNVTSEQRSETKSDKTTVNYTVYKGTCAVKYPMFFRLRDVKQDKVIFEGYINNSGDFSSRTTSEYRSYNDAKAQLSAVIKESKSNMFDSNLSDLNSHIINNYSYYPNSYRWSINYVESSKKTNYDDVVAAKDSTRTALATLSDKSAELSEDSKQKLTRAIALWQKILTESNIEDKKARIDKKVTMAIKENLAYCNFFLQNYTEALKIADAAREIDKQQWQYYIKQDSDDMKRRLEANNIAFN